MSKARIYDDYYNWLCNLARVKQVDKTYWLLFNTMMDTPFRWFIPNDDNRAFEGRSLRERFCDEEDINYREEDYPEEVSMLELIAALAYNCEAIMADQDDGMGIRDWFWLMMTNIGLDKFNDDDFYELKGHIIVNDILNSIMDRTYKRDGRGGLFPMKCDRRDQRKVELWYQMNRYLVENYYTEDILA